MILLTWCGYNYSTDPATAARTGGMVAASRVDLCKFITEEYEKHFYISLCSSVVRNELIPASYLIR
jgi:hypothetical protein